MARLWLNNADSQVDDAAPTREPLDFHRRLPGYIPTPLVDVHDLARDLGLGRLWLKDESSRLDLPSFKILGASWAVYRALDRHCGGLGEWETVAELNARLASCRPLTLAAATDGNHGRAVARMARLLSLDARIFVPSGTARARIEGIESEGASCDVVDGTYDDAVARSAEQASDRCLVISDTSWPGYEDIPRWVIDGYSTIFWEIEEQLESGDVDAVVIQLGVGALGAAAVRHWRIASQERPMMIGVEPERAACVLASLEAGRIVTIPGPHDSIMAGLNCGTPSLVAWHLVSAGFDAVVAIGDERARDGMRALARGGLVAGETGAAGVGCLIDLQASGAGRLLGLDGSSTVVVLSTEGATDPEAYESIVGSG
jgi:diaminopropionate ammonia-lyase